MNTVGTTCYLNGKEYEINKQIILNYLDTWTGTGWTNEDKQKIADEVVFRMEGLEIDTTAIQEFNFVEDAYTDAACCYIFSHNNSIQALLDEEDDLEIFDCMGMGKPQYGDEERDEI